MLKPQQDGGQQRETYELARGVEANSGGALTFREPGSDHLVVDWVRRGFEATDSHSQHDQSNEASGHAHEDCGHRPQHQANWVQQTRLNSVYQPTAR
ncbi:hypothetical protein D3C74_266460 [compost metagenome]